jgi:hypothetical protein
MLASPRLASRRATNFGTAFLVVDNQRFRRCGMVGSGGYDLSLAHTTKMKVHGPTSNFAGRRFATESESREWLLEDL